MTTDSIGHVHRWAEVMVLLASLGFLAGCDQRCGEQILTSIAAPKGDATAEIAEVNCGATAAFTEDVRISSKDFARDKQILFSYYHRAKLSIAWEDEHTLRIDCTDCKAENITTLTQISSPFRLHVTFPVSPVNTAESLRSGRTTKCPRAS